MVNILKVFKSSDNLWTDYLVCLIWGKNLFFGYLAHLPVIKYISSELPYMLILLCLLKSYTYLKRNITIYDILFYFCCIATFFLYEIMFPSNANIMEKFQYSYLLTVIPVFFIGRIIRIERLKQPLTLISGTFVILHAWYYLFYIKNVAYEATNDNMYASYLALPHVLMLIWYSISMTDKYQRLIAAFLSVIGIFTMLTFGTRGTIVCTASFICLYFFIFAPEKAKITSRIIFITILIAFYTILEKFMSIIDVLLMGLGFSNRITSLFLDDSFASGASVDARNDFREICMHLLNTESPMFGFGICGSWTYTGGYPHNLFVEILFSYGYLIGGILSIIFVYLIFNGYRYCFSKEEKGFWLLLFCTSFIKLQLSSSYLFDANLFLMIGYCLTKTYKYQSAQKNETTYRRNTNML